jgi:hypothetical protein
MIFQLFLEREFCVPGKFFLFSNHPNDQWQIKYLTLVLPVDTIENSKHKNMKELRVRNKKRLFRLFFAFDPDRNALLIIGGDKRGDKRFYQRMIPIADEIYDRYLKE